MNILEILKAALIGIVEGVTEWLPISSTGHMILVDEFIKLDVSPEFWEMFLVVIQLGAICAVILLFFNKLNPFAPSKGREGRRKTWLLWAKVVAGCIPAAIIGILFDDWFTENFHNALTVAIALVVYGIAFIVVERIKGPDNPAAPLGNTAPLGKHSREALEAQANKGQPSSLQQLLPASPKSAKAASSRSGKSGRSDRGSSSGLSRLSSNAVSSVDELGFGRALAIGLFQCLAIVPGTSRSGSTILGGRILGVSREAAAEFSFFLAIPIMFGWSLLKLVKGFVIDDVVFTATEWAVFFTGILVAFAVSVVAIKFLMSFIRKHSFEAFGWYRIILGIIVIAFFAFSGQLFLVQ